jgi:hypothetical protein
MVKRRLMGLGRQIQRGEGWVVMWDQRARHLRIAAVRRESGISPDDMRMKITYLVFSFLECSLNVVLRLPNAW